MNKFAIYTAVVGNYDEIKQPLVVDSRFDYFLFSDTIKEERIGVWQVKPIEYTNPDQVKIARYVKTHPETLLPDYKATLWLDSNIQIADSWCYNRFLELFNQEVLLASVIHPERDCIYEELFTVCFMQYESLDVVHKWNHLLRNKKYPKHNGLFETGVLFRMHSNSVELIDDCWWYYIEQYSHRDQLSFNFVLWERNMKCDIFFISLESVKSSGHFRCGNHLREGEKTKKVNQYHYLARLWNYHSYDNPLSKTQFVNKWLLALSFPLFFAKLIFYLWSQIIRLQKDIKFYFKCPLSLS